MASSTSTAQPSTSTTSSTPTSTRSTIPAAAQVSNKRTLWWKQSIVRRTASIVEKDLQNVIRQAPFLRNNAPCTCTALFHRSEIQTATSCLGKGGFSVVSAVVGFNLDAAVSARLTMEQQLARQECVDSLLITASGKPRFALKHLQERLLLQHKNDFARAACDLAVEAAYLSRLNHDGILKARGLPVDGVGALQDGKHDGYFILTDRLQESLQDRIQEWRKQQLMCCSSRDEQEQLERKKLAYALQIASALEYLHDNNIIFRDAKPHNIGFTDDNEIRLFDFGLVRELPSATCTVNDTFEMSGVGTRRYMAPEIITTARYNCKADVYGWSMVVWEMMSLVKPYSTYNLEQHRINVCQGGERPVLSENWSTETRDLLTQTWTRDISERLTMQQVCQDLQRMLTVVAVVVNKSLSLLSLDAPDSPVSTIQDTTLITALTRSACRTAPVFLKLPASSAQQDEDCLLRLCPTRSMSLSNDTTISSVDGGASQTTGGLVQPLPPPLSLGLTLESIQGIEVVMDAALERRTTPLVATTTPRAAVVVSMMY